MSPITELERLKNAAALIETMTQGRQTMKSCIGGAYISASDDTNFEILMDISTDDSPDDYRITFSSRSRMMGTEMDCNRLQELITEINQVYALFAGPGDAGVSSEYSRISGVLRGTQTARTNRPCHGASILRRNRP